MALVVTCTRPGLIRGGVRHPRAAAYPEGHFTDDQLAEMLAEPEIVIVRGEMLDLRPGSAANQAAVAEAENAGKIGRGLKRKPR